jgi:hypothetical protein
MTGRNLLVLDSGKNATLSCSTARLELHLIINILRRSPSSHL